ncbi:MAG: SdrD B-like domain-containing protein [Pirellulales bacterium]
MWADPQGDCNWQTGGIPLQGVVIELLDANGVVIRTTMTGADGTYKFENLAPGVSYGVREIQPAGYYNAGTHIGSAGGISSPGSDLVTQIVLGSGINGVNYDFCENLPASIAGRVWADPQGDCNWETGGYPLQGVVIELLDANGVVIRTTLTGADGTYTFDNLAPGTYSVHEIQPADYFNAGTHVGSAGGNAVAGSDRITAIVLGSGVVAVNYDFCENIPATISGSVWVDSNQNCKYEVGEKLLQGVTIELLDASGKVIATTQTDVNGFYKFWQLPPGEYQIREVQPVGYLDACDHVGTEGGQLTANDLIGKIVLGSGKNGQNYDFAEIEPAGIKGRVWADPQGDCNWATGGIPLAGVLIQLLDGNGTIIQTTLTGADGTYSFINLAPGTYTVHEVQPAGYYNAGTHVGSAGGNAVPGSDTVTQITLGSGIVGVNYDFCENLPASLSGKVWVENDDDRVFEAGEQLLAGVKIELLDEFGTVLATKFTDANGSYTFVNLQPGKIYGVRETQPTQYFQGGTLVGSSGGLVPFDDSILQVTLDSGENAVNYDFSEIPKSALSGYVFQDGPTIVLKEGETLGDLSAIRDGIRKAGDKPIAGVYILLGDIHGLPIIGDDGQPMIAVTDANGYYEFNGLRAGIYTVRQIQPEDYIDGLDRPGSTSGFAFNPNSTIPLFVMAELMVTPGNDFIARINVPIGRASVENNFSEVLVRTEVTPPLVIPPPVYTPPPLQYHYGNGIPGVRPEVLAQVLPEVVAHEQLAATNIRGNTWHLSVIDAGAPRTDRPEESKIAMVSMLNLQTWSNVEMDRAAWTLAAQDGRVLREFVFGNAQGIPVPGDYNGDGITEAGVYINGEWFIDLNNNGKWDKDDMWVKLGTEDDLPVVGDWDGDGKDDVGIYGPAWPRDPDAIRREPGLPVALNPPNGKSKNMPPLPEDAAVGTRSLKRGNTGKLRDDVIDHVFHYGTAGDHPIAGDWTGSGSDAIGVFREGTWNLDVDGNGRFDEHDIGATFGQAGDLPVVGDWDGDGVDDLGVYRDGTFILDTDGNHKLDDTDLRVTIAGAKAGGIPVAGDWDGDGRDEVGVYHPSAEAPAKPTDR